MYSTAKTCSIQGNMYNTDETCTFCKNCLLEISKLSFFYSGNLIGMARIYGGTIF